MGDSSEGCTCSCGCFTLVLIALLFMLLFWGEPDVFDTLRRAIMRWLNR